MMKQFEFQDGNNDRTVRNYGSSVKQICDYFRKDFLQLTEEDAKEYLAYLDRCVEKRELSEMTVLTYKRNLHSVAKYLELVSDDNGGFQNPFTGKVHGKKTAVRKPDSLEIREKKAADARRLLETIKENEAPQYFYIFSMMAYFYLITPVKICELKRKEIRFEQDKALFHFELGLHKPKTKVEGYKISEEQQRVYLIEFVLPKEINEAFVRFYPEYVMRIKGKTGREPESAFFNRNYQPVNFKTLGSIFRKNWNLLTEDGTELTIQSIRDLCGVLFQDELLIWPERK